MLLAYHRQILQEEPGFYALELRPHGCYVTLKGFQHVIGCPFDAIAYVSPDWFDKEGVSR